MIKASAILAAALGLTFVLRRRSAAERHSILAAAIVSAALLPVLSFVLPSWEPRLAERVALALPQVHRALAGPGAGRGSDVIFRAVGIESGAGDLDRIWFTTWLAGSILSLMVFATGVARQRWFACQSRPLSDPSLYKTAVDLACRLGCRRKIRLLQSGEQSMPMTWGVLRPAVLLPDGASGWPEERKRVVLAHELAHVYRADWFFQMVAQSACAVYWFNPLFWIASNRLRRESEQACDDAVLTLGVDARDYAAHLLEIARSLKHSGRVWSPVLAMARPTTVERRFIALLNSALNRRAVTRKTAVAVILGMLVIVLPLAALRAPDAGVMPAGLARVDQYTAPPLYSDEARSLGVEGVVTVEVRVGAMGNVEGLRVVKGLGHGLDENALLAVRDWRFVPARPNGLAIASTTHVDVEFSLRNAEINELIANDMATRVGPGVTPPQVVHRVDPQYPAANKPKTHEGAVVLDAIVLEDGAPRIVRVIRSLDWDLDEIAIKALEQWRFSPAMKAGQPVKVRMNVAVHFNSR